MLSCIFNYLGNIGTTILKGNADCETATRDLQASVTEFNSALILLNTRMGIRAVRKLGDIDEQVKQINERVKGRNLRFTLLIFSQKSI